MRHEEAITYYDKSIEMNPNCSKYHYSKGFSLHSLNRYKNAIQSFDKSIKINPNELFVRNKRDVTFRFLNRYHA